MLRGVTTDIAIITHFIELINLTNLLKEVRNGFLQIKRI